MKKNKKKLILLVMLMSIAFTKINTVKAGVSGSSIYAGSSASGASTDNWTCKKTGLPMSASGSFTGYRLTVVKLKDDGTYDDILYQNDYVRKGNYKYATGGGAKIWINTINTKDSKKCKTRFGLMDKGASDCLEWKQVPSNSDYYKARSKTTLLTGDYNWKKVADHYTKIAGSYSKTIKFLKKHDVDTSGYSKTEVEYICPDGKKSSTDKCTIKLAPCDTTKSTFDFTTAFSTSYDSGKKKCVSYANPTKYNSVPTGGYNSSNKRWTVNSNYNSENGSYTQTIYKCNNGWRTYKTSNGNIKCKKSGTSSRPNAIVHSTKTKYVSVTCPSGYKDNGKAQCIFEHGTDNLPGKTTVSPAIHSTETTTTVDAETKACVKGKKEILKLWIIVEPMFSIATCATGSQRTYYGTATELAKITNNGTKAGINKDAFADFRGNYGLWSGFLYMKKDSFQNEDNVEYSFSKLIKKSSNSDFNSDGTYKNGEYLYSQKNGSNIGIGVGIIWLGEASESLEDSCTVDPYCDNDATKTIKSCVEKYTKAGYSSSAANGICQYEECDDTIEKCDVCDDDGREIPKTLNLVEELKKNITTTSTKQQVIAKATEIKNNFYANSCKSPTYEETKTGGDFTCSNYYRNDKRITVGTSLKEGEKNYVCSTSQINRNGTATGALGKCTIYCTETADLSFPGNVKETITAGDSFEWPSKSTDNYKMQVDYNITCTAINTSGAKNTSCDYTVDLDNFKSELGIDTASVAKLTYDNVKYSFGSLELDTLSDNIKYQISKDGGKNWNNGTADELYDGYKLKLSASYKYYIPEKLYYYQDDSKIYYNKDDNKAKNTFDNKGVGRLATKAVSSITQDYTKTYDDGLHLDLVLGNNNSIGSVVTNYTCKYNVENPPGPGPCVCPDGTKHAGESLEILKLCTKDKATCTENIEDYCNLDWPTDLFKSCKCKNCDNKETDLTDCIKQNKGAYEYCYHKQCTEKCDSKCYGYKHCKWTPLTPRGNNYYDSYYYCYPTEDDKNNNRIEKAELCDEDTERIYCPERKCENKIIYRTIDLENPFPGQNENGVTTEFSLTNTKGRYPGINWNNSNWVKNKITNAREVSGNEIYKQEPLYTITLTPEIMKEIRTINKENKYDAYKNVMKCNDGNTEDCTNGFYVSIVLRNVLDKYNSLSGTCGSLKSVAAIKQCYEDNSSSAYKYTYKN